MKHIISLSLIFLVFIQTSFAQETRPAFSFCGKTGEVTMTWDEFMACKKELVTLDKNVSISSFVLTVRKAVKKDYVFVEFPSKNNLFGKGAMELIEQLHKDKKLGERIEIDGVEIVQSGKAAKKAPGMVIILN